MVASNIVLIILDTLRKDYGEKYIWPLLKRYGFVYYPNAIAPAPWTIPTHVSILTGRYPAIHRVHETHELKIPRIKLKSQSEELILAKLIERGYSTILISANSLIQPTFGFTGFDRSYDIFWVPPQKLSKPELETLKRYSSKRLRYLLTPINLTLHGKLSLLGKAAINYWSRIISTTLKKYPLEKGISRAVQILKNTKLNDKNFIFVNLMEVHEPYSMKYPSQGGIVLTLTNQVTEDIIKDWKKGYKREAEYLQNRLDALLQALKQRIDFKDSLIIITSDHGQLLGEGDRIGHGAFLDDELIRVPLWIKYPGHFDIPNKDFSRGYISLTQLYHLISSFSINDENIFPMPQEVVFSESYGSPSYIPKEKIPKGSEHRIKDVEKYRIAIHYTNFKGIFNVTDWKFEEIISYDPKIEVTEDIVKHMKKEVIKFLKTATAARVPKIKI